MWDIRNWVLCLDGGKSSGLALLDQMLVITRAMGPLCQTQKGLCPGLKSCLNTLKYAVTDALWHITFIGLEERDSNHSEGIFVFAVLLLAYFVTFEFLILK